MKRNHLIYFILTFVFPSLLFSQITITQSDFTSLYTIGSTQLSFADTLTESVDIGQPGGGNNWNFTNLIPHLILESAYLSPTETPYADSFASANVANYLSQMIDAGDGSTGTSESWSFFNSIDGSTHGSASLNTFTDMSGTTVTETISRHFPPFAQYDFPITANKIWTTKDSLVTTVYSGVNPAFASTITTVYDIHIDAWGSMTMPSGKAVDALRSREVSTTTTYFGGFPISTSISVHYFFMGKNGESVSILADSENPPNSGVITGLTGWGNDDLTGVEKLESVPAGFALKQNYPNPFNPSTKIEYAIAEPSHVNLVVYDILGNTVTELVSENQTAGKYRFNFDGSNLATGTYLIQLRAGNSIQSRKMVLLK